MKYEIPVFILLIAVGLMVKKFDWRAQFGLFLFIATWVMYSWKKG